LTAGFGTGYDYCHQFDLELTLVKGELRDRVRVKLGAHTGERGVVEKIEGEKSWRRLPQT